jgi:hypothetical protein
MKEGWRRDGIVNIDGTDASRWAIDLLDDLIAMGRA